MIAIDVAFFTANGTSTANKSMSARRIADCFEHRAFERTARVSTPEIISAIFGTSSIYAINNNEVMGHHNIIDNDESTHDIAIGSAVSCANVTYEARRIILTANLKINTGDRHNTRGARGNLIVFGKELTVKGMGGNS